MSHVFANVESKTRPSDRRVFGRQPVRSLAYVELGEGNGGIVLNVSEGGLAVQAVMSLMTEELPRMRLQLAHSKKQIEAKGRIVWTSEFKKLAGVEFVDLSPEALSQIREWLSIETPKAHGTEKTSVGKSETSVPVTPVPTHSQVADAPAPLNRPEIATNWEAKLPDTKRPEEPAAQSPALPVDPEVSAAIPVATAAAVPVPDVHSRPSISPPADRYGFNRGASPPEGARIHSRKKVAALVGAFAIVSLAIGWAAGRAGLRRVIGHSTGNENQPVESVSEPVIISPNISEIEVVDANNQRWVIPFSGPPTASKRNVPSQTGESISSSSGEIGATNRASAISSPIPAKSSTADGGSASSAPPPPAPLSTNVKKGSPLTSIANSPLPAAAPRAPARAATASDNDLQPGKLLHRVEPDYPADALAQGIEGIVKLYAVINEDGTVKTVQALSGPSALFPAAINAVNQWRYSPAIFEGRPVQTERQITITFQLSPPQPK